MRTQTIGQLTLYYPDYLVYGGDVNYVMLKVPSHFSGALLSVTVDGKVQSYESEGNTVIVDISLLLKRVGQYGQISVHTYVMSVSPAYSNTFDFTIYYTRGVTLADRYHGSGRRVVLPSGITGVDILAVGACTISGGGASQAVSAAQIVSYPVSASGPVTVHYAIRRGEGYVNDPGEASEAVYDVEVYDCQPKSGCVIRWYDADGCARYLVGKIQTRGTKAGKVDYAAVEWGEDLSILRNGCGRIVTAIERTIEVGVAQVSEAMHLEEILYSPEVALQTADGWLPIVPDYDSAATSMTETSDIILKFKVQQ